MSVIATNDAMASAAELSWDPSLCCPLCCESGPSAHTVIEFATLSICRHRSCLSCLVRWMEREEASGQTESPSCPFCRSTIRDEDVWAILGRPFRPRESSVQSVDADEIDELTRHWLDENTVACGSCGHRIEKESGCDLIECLCGFRFCYRCGVPGGECDCNPGHTFLDDEEYDSDEEPIRDRTGRVDLPSCIRRRELRREREVRREEVSSEQAVRWWFSPTCDADCTAIGRWLFVPRTDAGSIRMLAQQLDRERVYTDRYTDRYWRRLRTDDDPYLDVSWIFARRGSELRVRRQRLALFSLGERVQRLRVKRERELEAESMEVRGDLQSLWLFLPGRSGVRMLEGLEEAWQRRAKRAAAPELDLMEDVPSIDAFLRSGAWLFQRAAPDASRAHLARLWERFWRRKEDSRTLPWVLCQTTPRALTY